MLELFLFLFTGIIGMVTMALMITSYRTNPFYNTYLLLIIITISFRFLVRGSFELGLQSILSPDRGLDSIFYLTIVPCFYLYHKNLTLQSKTFNPKDLKHIISIVFLYMLNTNQYIAESYMLYFGQITNFIFIGFFILIYLVLIFKILSKNIWFKKDLLINNKHFKLVKNWTIYLFTFNVLAGITLLTSFYTEIYTEPIMSGKSMAILLLFFWLFIYFKILFTPEILYGLPILNKKFLKFSVPKEVSKPPKIATNDNWILEINYQKNNDQDLKLQEKIMDNIASYIHEVDKLSKNEFVFRDPKASHTTLANHLGVPTSHIVYLFKYHSKTSFSEYRMTSRIQDATKLIEYGFLTTETLESLASKTGFASYNPFFSAFKKVTTFSPQDYLKSIKS